MANILIYGGLSVLLIATLIFLYGAIRGLVLSKKISDRAAVKKAVKKYVETGYIVVIIGFIVVGLGMFLSSN